MEYCIKLANFEGPLDLLLHLVKEADISIYDIDISKITDQYMEYIHTWNELNIEVSSSYLVMAASLMEIKSKSLLPNTNLEKDIDEDEIDSREGLIQRLVEYQKYKEVTKNFKALELDRRKIYTKAPSKIKEEDIERINCESDASIDDLIEAFQKFLDRKNQEKPIHTKITKKEYSVKKRKHDICTFLKIKKKAEFTELFDIYNKSYVVVTFMSILELAKENMVILKQEKNFDKLFIELRNLS